MHNNAASDNRASCPGLSRHRNTSQATTPSAHLSALLADKNSHVFVYDADPANSREKMGVIPGAIVLSSWNKFDVATELPRDKNAKLVFYCHNWL